MVLAGKYDTASDFPSRCSYGGSQASFEIETHENFARECFGPP